MVPPIFNPRAAGQTAGAVWIAHRAIIIPRAQERKRPVSGIYFPSRGDGYNPRAAGQTAEAVWIAHRAIIIPHWSLIWNIPYYAN